MSNKILKYLEEVKESKGAGYILLIDPDRKSQYNLEDQVLQANENGVDAIFVGGSLMMDSEFHRRIEKIKKLSKIPVIFFPGGSGQLSKHYDAILFMSVLSGRNPHYLIGEQVIAAPIIKDLGIETIPTAYLLLDGGAKSTVEFMSGSLPIPMSRPDIVVAHALAGQFLGMKIVYLEAGSGAKQSVPVEVIKLVSANVEISTIVGGGIRTPEDARAKVKAGAGFIVTGTIMEAEGNGPLMKEFADAVHWKNS